MSDDIQSLSHSRWRCKYHIVFAPKYRRRIVYGELKADIGRILRMLCEQKGVEIGSYSIKWTGKNQEKNKFSL